MEQNSDPRNKSMHIWSTSIWQRSQEYSREQSICLINGGWKTEYSHLEKNETRPLFYTTHKY